MGIDECKNNPCKGANTKCVNTPGDYKCECAEGYALDENKKCVEVAECIDDDSCGDNAICEDLKGAGKFKCHCKCGFEKNAKGECVDKNECASRSTHNCD